MASYYAADYNRKATRLPEGGNGFNESMRYVHPTGGLAAASKIYYGIIPAGVEINSCKLVHDAQTASLTEKLGYEPVNADNGPSAVLDYFFGATAVTTAGAVTSTAHPIVFDYPVKIVGTLAGATSTAASVSTVVMSGKVVGVK